MNQNQFLQAALHLRSDSSLLEAEKIAQDYTISNCADARMIWVSNSETGQKQKMLVGCGKCYHCKESKINEWVNRMWAETESYPYCYFITLTYKSYESYDAIPGELTNAYWHYDNFNKSNRYCFSPCLLRIEHFQKFIRNLRNDLRAAHKDADLSYYCAGEFGENFHRPHFHVLIWSRSVISHFEFDKAWSVRSGKRYMKLTHIGNVDYNNLCDNGTIISPEKDYINIDGGMFNTKYCFSYVAKYVGKNDQIHDKRFQMFLNDMHNQKSLEDFEKMKAVFSGRVLRLLGIQDKAQRPSGYCLDPFTGERVLMKQRIQEINQKYKSRFDKHNEELKLNRQVEKACKLEYRDLLSIFGTVHTSSRSHGIGGLWLAKNIDYLAAGEPALPEKAPLKTVVPGYFLRKIKDYINPIGVRSTASPSGSYCKANRPLLYKDLQRFAFSSSVSAVRQFTQVLPTVPVGYFVSDGPDFAELIRLYSLKNMYNGHRYLLVIVDDDLKVQEYVYNRVHRMYDFIRSYEFRWMYEKYFAPWFLESMKRGSAMAKRAELCMDDRKNALKVVEGFLDTFGRKWQDLLRDSVDAQDEQRKQLALQRKYKRKQTSL